MCENLPNPVTLALALREKENNCRRKNTIFKVTDFTVTYKQALFEGFKGQNFYREKKTRQGAILDM
jgi:hypothetical protein